MQFAFGSCHIAANIKKKEAYSLLLLFFLTIYYCFYCKRATPLPPARARPVASRRSLLFFIELHSLARRLQQFVFLLAAHDHILEIAQTSTCRYRMACDNVLLQTEHVVALALNSGRRQYLGRFLERSGRDPALRTQRGLGDTQQQRRGSRSPRIPELGQLLIVTTQDGILLPHFPQRHDLTSLQLR